ncbi:C-C chemokine receptor type 7-like [Orbicella faveolata]|uniref:C-C chemokine receptor type 7-like n=1 Tax=Orbicella faveolata TaxID=48498 RepID=UPI0009E4A708|nr:C-C chemokine receptor type 7-like [Orbicella faveolata]
MPTVTCGGEFQFLEFLIFFVVFVVGLTSNVLFILLSCKELVNLKGCPVLIYNGHLLHYSIANLILLIRMPLDVISFTSGGSWFFGEHFCRLNFFVERAMYMAIANHILNLVRDAFTPYGYPNSPIHWRSTWFVSLLFVCPLLFTTLEQTPEGCTRCTLIDPSLGMMWMFQWTEQVYVAILPLLAIWFYHGKYVEHPDYEALHKAGPDDVGGHVKMNLRSMCCALALTICLCTSPARLTEISGGDFKLWPGHQIIFFFTPRLLIYGQTVIFIGVYAYHYPRFYQGAKIAAARLWSCRTIPGKIVTGQDDDHKEPLS